MEVINLANGQVGVCHFEARSCFSSGYSWNPYSSSEFSITRHSIMGVSVNTKRVRSFGLRIRAKGESGNSSVGGGVIEKEFEFKPSFNDYLKAMEFVKTVKEKKQVDEVNGHNPEQQGKENSGTALGRDESVVKFKRFGRSVDGKRVEEDDRGGVTVREKEVNAELDYREKRNRNSNVKTGGKEIRADANVNTKVIGARVDGRRMNIRSTSVKPNLESFNFGKGARSSNAAESSSESDDLISRASTVWKRERSSHGNDTPQVFERRGRALQVEESGSRGNRMNVKLASHHSQVFEGKGRAFQVEESGSRGNRMNVKLVSHHGQVDKISLRRSSQNYENSDDDDSLEVERAAFKNIEGLDEVICKPHTAKREMEERIQKLAKWLNGADIDMPEWMFSKSMRSAKIRYTDHSILRIVQLLGKLGNWRRVLQLIEWLQMRERYKSNRLRNVYTTALNVLGKARRPVEALNVFRVMQQQTATYPDIVVYRSIAVTLGQAGHMKELFDVIDSMRAAPKKSKLEELKKWDPRLEPDGVVYHAVLNACVQRKQWEGAFWVLQQLKLQGQQPSTSTYGLIMEVMLACEKYNLVHEFFRKVKRSSTNALVYRVLVTTLWREGKTDEAVLAVQDMERRGIVGSAALYYDLARCLISAGRCQEALLQIEKICKVANKPLVVTYTGLIQACLEAGNIENAVFVFNEMKNFCSPNLVTCNIMLKAYIDHGLYEKASELFNNMLQSDHEVRVFPDIYTFNTMLDACIAEKRWDDFERVYRRMLHHGYHFNEKRHLRMILDASRAGKGELLEITRKHLYLTDRSIPPSLVKERFCVMLERDNIDAALACIVTISAGESQAYSKAAWSKLLNENGMRFRKDTLVRLINEVSILVAKRDVPNQVLESLYASCKGFLMNERVLSRANLLPEAMNAGAQENEEEEESR